MPVTVRLEHRTQGRGGAVPAPAGSLRPSARRGPRPGGDRGRAGRGAGRNWGGSPAKTHSPLAAGTARLRPLFAALENGLGTGVAAGIAPGQVALQVLRLGKWGGCRHGSARRGDGSARGSISATQNGRAGTGSGGTAGDCGSSRDELSRASRDGVARRPSASLRRRSYGSSVVHRLPTRQPHSKRGCSREAMATRPRPDRTQWLKTALEFQCIRVWVPELPSSMALGQVI